MSRAMESWIVGKKMNRIRNVYEIVMKNKNKIKLNFEEIRMEEVSEIPTSASIE